MTLVGAAGASAWAAIRSREPRSAWEEIVAGAPRLELAACREVPGPEHAGGAVAVLDGVVRGYTGSPGGRQLTLRYARAGDLTGLTAAVDATDEVCLEAVTPVVVAALSRSRLHELSLRRPEFAWALVQELASVSTESMRLLAAAQAGSTLSQVAAHLLEWTEASAGHAVARVSHQQLAAASGTAREVVTRALAGLRDAGIVETRRGAVVVIDTAALERVASGGNGIDQVAGGSPLSSR